jgi:hypothetical protein
VFRFLTSPIRISISIPGASSVLNMLDRIRRAAASAASAVGGALRGRIPFFAGGTTNFRGGTALVGERGPELVDLPRGSRVHTAQDSARAMRGNGDADLGTYTIVVKDQDARTIQTQLLKLKRRNGNLSLGLA